MRPISLLGATLAISACSIGAVEEPAVSLSSAPDCADLLSRDYARLDISITTEEDRQVPATVLYPEAPGVYPLIAFSHGAFAAPDRYLQMLGPLAAAGNIVVAPMHVDSEEFRRAEPAGPAETWQTRNRDMTLALKASERIDAALSDHGITIDRRRTTAMGHSYGALMAQLAGGAQAIEDDGTKPNRRLAQVDAVIAWSPPGVIEGRMTAESWGALAVPSLTITGSSDVLPGFIDNWEDHKASYMFAPAGSAELWVGDGIDHYFGGMFGREKPADSSSRALFQQALEAALAFMQRNMDVPSPCIRGELIDGEIHEKR